MFLSRKHSWHLSICAYNVILTYSGAILLMGSPKLQQWPQSNILATIIMVMHDTDTSTYIEFDTRKAATGEHDNVDAVT